MRFTPRLTAGRRGRRVSLFVSEMIDDTLL